MLALWGMISRKLSEFLEGMYGNSVKTKDRLFDYQYECRFFNEGPSRNFIAEVVRRRMKTGFCRNF
jgi:hypothetical protein